MIEIARDVSPNGENDKRDKYAEMNGPSRPAITKKGHSIYYLDRMTNEEIMGTFGGGVGRKWDQRLPATCTQSNRA